MFKRKLNPEPTAVLEMTEQERVDAFVAKYNELCVNTGLAIVARVVPSLVTRDGVESVEVRAENIIVKQKAK